MMTSRLSRSVVKLCWAEKLKRNAARIPWFPRFAKLRLWCSRAAAMRRVFNDATADRVP